MQLIVRAFPVLAGKLVAFALGSRPADAVNAVGP